MADALKAFERSDWTPATRLLREAIVKQPANITLHYYLAIAATHLQLRDEAVREFQWVIAHAPADSPEARAARQWLREAGIGGAGAAQAAAPPPSEADSGPPTGVKGQVVWNDPQDPVSVARLQLFLKGLPNSPTSEQYYVLRTDNDGQFEFKKVVPGPYKLTDRIAGKPHWRLRVTVQPGEATALDLTTQNSTRTRDDFPQDDK